jgi:tetratricopeptide (TPR) repeat protein
MGGIDDAHYSYHTNESPEFLGVAFSRISANYRLETNSEKSDLSAYGIHAIPKYDQIEEYEMTGRLNEAESMLKKEIEARDQIFGSSSLCTLVLLTDLARVLEKHNLEEAEQQQRRLIGGLARYLGKQHRRWAEAQMHLAGMLDNRGSRQESVDIFRNVFQARQETHTFDDLHTLNAGIELSWALAKHQQLEEAQELIERMIDGMSKQQGARHPWTIHAKFYHVRILRARRYFDVEWEALNSLEKDLKEITEGNKLQKCRLVLERANHFKDLEKLDQAELAALDAIKIVTKLKLLGGSDLHLATLRTLATIQGEKGDRLQEEVSLRQIVTFEGSRSGEGPLVWNTKHQLAACLKSQARLGEAFHVAGEVLEASKGAIKRDSNSIIGCMIIQSSVLQSMGSIKEAAELLQIASNKCKLELGNEHLHTISLEYHLASIFFTAGNMEKAVFVYEEILPRLLRKHHPQVSPHDIMCLLEQALIVIGEHDKAQKYRDMMGVGSLCAASPVDCSLEACAISGSMALTPS